MSGNQENSDGDFYVSYFSDSSDPEKLRYTAEAARMAVAKGISEKIENNKMYVISIRDSDPRPYYAGPDSPFYTDGPVTRNTLNVSIQETHGADNAPIVHGALYFRDYAGDDYILPFLSIRIKYRCVGRDDIGRWKYQFVGEA